MRKNKLLLLLALLLTAATGAWAQEPATTYSVKKLTVPDTWTGDMTTFSAADLPSDFAAVGDDVVTTIPAPTATGNAVLIYGFSGGETKFVEYANGVQSATNSSDFPRDQIYGYVNIMGYEGVYYTSAASSGYTVSLKDGVKDADKWTVKVGEGQAQALPIGGLKGDGSETVTLQYNGRLKVKGVKATSDAAAAAKPIEVLTYSFDDASHPSGLTAGSRVAFDYSRTSVITNSKFLNAYNNANGDPYATTVSLGDTDLSGETWTLSFEWAACGGCNSKPDHTTLKAGNATLFDLSGNSNWNTTVTIIYTGSDGSKTLPVPGCDKSNRFTEAVGDQYNTTTYWHHIVVTGSAEGVKMTITNSSTGAAVVEDVVLSETNVNPTSLIIEPSCGGGIGIDALSLTYEE